MSGIGQGFSGPRSSRDRVYNALADRGYRPTKQSDDFHALCPVHDESTQSLHVTWKRRDGGPAGLVVLRCFGCHAEPADIAAAIGLSMQDLFDEPLPERTDAGGRVGRSPRQRVQGKARPKAGRLPERLTRRAAAGAANEPEPEHAWVDVETYTYVDGDAVVVQEVIRRRCTSCDTTHKTFAQRFATRSGRMAKTAPAGFTPVLYRLPEVCAAVAVGRSVWLLEGEKDVHTAEALGLVATTNPGGGAVFPESMADELAGADVVVVLDRDDTGWARGVLLHELLTARGAQVRLRLPATTAAKSDFTDHVEAGHGIGDLVDVTVEEVRAWASVRALSVHLAGIRECDDEADARLALAAEAVAAGRQEAEATERRYAQRWATAALVRWEGLRDDVDRTRALAVQAGTDWGRQAGSLASSMLMQGRDVALDVHERTGAQVPAELRAEQEPSRPTGADATPTTGVAQAKAAGALPMPKGMGRPWYELRKGCIVQVRRETKVVLDPETEEPAEEVKETETLLLNLDVQLVAYEYPDTSEQADMELARLTGRDGRQAAAIHDERRPTHVVFSYTHPATGERELIRVEHDRAVDSSWLATLGLPGLIYDSKAAGRSKLWDAIRQISLESVQHTLYLGTGWRLLPEHGWAYIHGGGAITAKGNVPVPVHLSGALRRFDLPDPTTDAGTLREAWTQHAMPLIDELPERVCVPLIGHMFRAVLGVNPWLGLLVGSPGSRKTGLASILMHFYGEAWDRRRPAVSMSGNGSTDNAIRFMANKAADAVLFLDDVAPGKDLTEGQVRMGRIARMLTNGEERSRLDRTGQTMHDGTAPRTTGLMTSELMPRPGSEAERMFPLPLQASQVPLEVLIRVDAAESRYARALLGASFRQWLAADLPTQQDRVATIAGEYAAGLREQGRPDRESDAYGQLYAGWEVLTSFLVEVAAIGRAERDALLVRVDQALWEAMRAAENPDIPLTVGGRVREMLAHALSTGLAHVVDIETGECPEWPLASRLGWRRTLANGGPLASVTSASWKYDPRGVFAGYVNLASDGPAEAELVMQRLQLEQVIKAAAQGLADAPLMDSGTALRALSDSGVLVSARSGGTGSGWTSSRTIRCIGARRRMVVLDLKKLFGDEEEGGDGHRGGGRWDDGPDLPDSEGPGGRHLRPVDDPSPAGDGAKAPAAQVLPFERPDEDDVEHQAYVDQVDQEEDDVPQQEEPAASSAQCCPVCGRNVADSIREAFEGLHPLCAPPDVRERGLAIIDARHGNAAASPAAPTSGTAQEPPATPQQPADPQPATAEPAEPAAAEAAAASATATSALQLVPTVRTTWDGRPERSEPAVAVCDVDRIVLGTGTIHPLPETIEHIGDLAVLAQRYGLRAPATRGHVEPGTVVITDALARQLGLPVADLPNLTTRRSEAFEKAAVDHPFLTRALEAGWQVPGRQPVLRGWTRLTHPEHPAARVAIASVMVGAVVEGVEGADGRKVGADPDAESLARRLQLYADHVGYPWRVAASATGTDLMIGLRWNDREELFTPATPVPPAQVPLEPDLNWSRIPYEHEQECQYLHVYDRGGSYAAGIAGLELPIGEPTHHCEGLAFDAKMPGLWRVEIPEPADVRMPNPLYVLPHHRLDDGTAWVATPTAALAQMPMFDVPVRAHEAYVWERHARLLNSWYERIRDARTALDTDDLDDQIARKMVKETYAMTIAQIGSRGSWVGKTGYFPERRLMIISKARSNLLYRVRQIAQATGDRVWPVAMSADSVAYVSNEPDPWKAWPGDPKLLGRGLGQFKPERSGELAGHLQHLDGARWTAKTKLPKVSDWLRQLKAAQGAASTATA